MESTVTEVAKPLMTQISEVIASIGALAWPLIFISMFIMYRHSIGDLFDELIEKIRASSNLKFGYFEIMGVEVPQHGDVIGDDVREDDRIEMVSATLDDYKSRHKIYASQHNLMLVHTIRPKEPENWTDGNIRFDVSIFIHPHSKYGRINDVKSVTYYLGDHWGDGKYGMKFKLAAGNDRFALRATAYGSFLCVAEVEFHTGEQIKIHRYIDTEMLPVYSKSERSKAKQH